MQPNPEVQIVPGVSPRRLRSLDAFYRNLPDLLKTHYCKWVAYHGDEFLGTAGTETELYQRCLGRGFPEDEFFVMFVDNQALHDREVTFLPPDR
jgi:hypothetical protein